MRDAGMEPPKYNQDKGGMPNQKESAAEINGI
jgi:hypothetical protein